MATMNFSKLPSNKNVTVWESPSGGTTLGITDVDEPLAAEINNTGGTSGVINATVSIDWNDFDLGTQESETSNQPSLADAGSYTTFGVAQYGGSMSYFLPAEWDDNSNNHSVIWDLTHEKYHRIDAVKRVDGLLPSTVPAVNGDFVSVYRLQAGADANVFAAGEDKRHTVTYNPRGDFSHYTVVGDHAITAIVPAATPWVSGGTGRIRASQGGRDRTNALSFSTSNGAVIQVWPGGYYEVSAGAAARTATVTITDKGTGDTQTVTVNTTV